MTLRAGTRIETHGTPAFPGFPGVVPEQAIICRWTKVNGPIPNHLDSGDQEGGWHVVKFADGGKLLMHESNFRVIDNRA